MINVGIVGGGKGGTSLLKTLHTVPEVKIIGIADLNKNAPGMVLARQYQIDTLTDYIKLMQYPDRKIIIDATGLDKVKSHLHELADGRTEIVDSSAGLLMILMVESREKLIDELENQSSQMAELASDLSETMLQISEASQTNVSQLYDSVCALAGVIQANNNQLEETHEIINFIKRVSGQTKLLGLNASIEAARAGSAGTGFHVVAQEIRKLADDSSQSTQKINGIIEQIKSSTKETEQFVEQIKANADFFVKHQDEYTALLHKVASQIESLAKSLNELSEK